MQAYVFIKSINDYKYVDSDDIVNFEYEDIGHQPRDFAKKPFQCNVDDKRYQCQILIVAETKKDVKAYLKMQRPKVPKLNASDFPEDSEQNTHIERLHNQKKKAAITRKDQTLKKNTSKATTALNIISEYNKTLQPDSDTSDKAPSDKSASKHLSDTDDNNRSDSDNDNSIQDNESVNSNDSLFEEAKEKESQLVRLSKKTCGIAQQSSSKYVPKSTPSQQSQRNSIFLQLPNSLSPRYNDDEVVDYNDEENSETEMVKKNVPNGDTLQQTLSQEERIEDSQYRSHNKVSSSRVSTLNKSLPRITKVQHNIQNIRPNAQIAQLNLQRRSNATDVEQAYQDEKRKRLRAEKAVKHLHDQYNAQKKRFEELMRNKEADDAEQRVITLKRKAFPSIINTESGIRVKRSAVENAYKQIEPAKFCATMFKATWGYEALSKRCVQRSRKTLHLEELTPKKKLAVQKHFEHMLNYYNDDPSVISYHFNRLNNYANRAINSAKKKMDLLARFPDLDKENLLSDEEIEL